MKFWALSLLFFITSCTANLPSTNNQIKPTLDETKLSGTALDAYNNGRILILYSYSDSVATSEAFADWQGYLKDFSMNEGDLVYKERITTALLTELTNLTTTETEFTLFLKTHSPSYFYSDFIVEPQVYSAVKAAYSGDKMTAENRAFLPEEIPTKQYNK